jgi:hypothetical protein
MQHPEYIYYAAMILVALPMAWFAKNAVAFIVFATWAVGQAAYEMGLPEPEMQLLLYGAALVLGVCNSKSSPDLFASILFFPLAVSCASEIMGLINPTQAWWAIFWIALTQATSLPFNLDWRAAFRRWRARSKGGGSTGMHQLARA